MVFSWALMPDNALMENSTVCFLEAGLKQLLLSSAIPFGEIIRFLLPYLRYGAPDVIAKFLGGFVGYGDNSPLLSIAWQIFSSNAQSLELRIFLLNVHFTYLFFKLCVYFCVPLWIKIGWPAKLLKPLCQDALLKVTSLCWKYKKCTITGTIFPGLKALFNLRP